MRRVRLKPRANPVDKDAVFENLYSMNKNANLVMLKIRFHKAGYLLC